MNCVFCFSVLLLYIVDFSMCASIKSKMKDRTSLILENQVFDKQYIVNQQPTDIIGLNIESSQRHLRLKRAIGRRRRFRSRSSFASSRPLFGSSRSSFGSSFGSSRSSLRSSRPSLGGFASRWTAGAGSVSSMRQRHLASLRRRTSIPFRSRSSFPSRRPSSRPRMRAIPRARIDSFAMPQRLPLPSFGQRLMTGLMLDALDTPDRPDIFDVL